MLISDHIARMIEQMLESGDGEIKLRRNDLAEKIGCVPSQINYVISSRFTPERGYIIESRRGGGGYVRIRRKIMDYDTYLMHFLYALGHEVDVRSAEAFLGNLQDNTYITEKEHRIVSAVLQPLSSLPQNEGNQLRADILRQLILSIMK